jgi:hypothetical protein
MESSLAMTRLWYDAGKKEPKNAKKRQFSQMLS